MLPRIAESVSRVGCIAVAALLVAVAAAEQPAPPPPNPPPATPTKNDADFVRRVYLDLIGRIPMAEEIQAFLDDKGADKRERLVEKLANQPPLETLLDQALKNNPDVRLAEAKLREAEADLNRTRLQVMQKVVALHQSLEGQRSAVKEVERRLKTLKALHQRGGVANEEVEAGVQQVVREKAKLASLEAEMPYLLGRTPAAKTVALSPDGKLLASGGGGDTIRLWEVASGKLWMEMRMPAAGVTALAFSPDGRTFKVQLPTSEIRLWDVATGKEFKTTDAVPLRSTIPEAMAEKIRKALDRPIKVDYVDKTASEVLDDLLGKIDGVPVQVRGKVGAKEPFTFRFTEPLPLGAALQALLDGEAAGTAMVVRDYGILVTHAGRAPADAMSLHEFWKHAAPAAPAKHAP